jgi:hypothetical protein
VHSRHLLQNYFHFFGSKAFGLCLEGGLGLKERFGCLQGGLGLGVVGVGFFFRAFFLGVRAIGEFFLWGFGGLGGRFDLGFGFDLVVEI